MDYWDQVTHIHGMMSKDIQNGTEGMKAVCFLASFLKGVGCMELPRDHSLTNRLRMGSESNYAWLIQYARKLRTASSIPGFGFLSGRFADSREYYAAHYEIEVALKLSLAGMDVRFLGRGSERSSDMMLKLRATELNVEVTSLNPPDDETRFHSFISALIMVGPHNDVVMGGFVSRLPSAAKIKEILAEAASIRDKAWAAHEMKVLRVPGIAVFYVAPSDLTGQMPEDCRGQFQFLPPSRKHIEQLVREKVQGKRQQLAASDRPGLLFIHTQMVNRQTLAQLYESERDDTAVLLATYPDLLGLILIAPHYGELPTESGEIGTPRRNSCEWLGDLSKDCFPLQRGAAIGPGHSIVPQTDGSS
jgi:hypothetical protein